MNIAQLNPFVGEWRVEAFGTEGRCGFEWALGGRFLIQRMEVPAVPEAPDVLALIAPEGDRYRQHYFDSRGVVRLYEMTFDGREWTLSREATDFSALAFRQRFTGAFDEGGDTIRGAWERTGEAGDWQLDFEVAYFRVS